MKYHFFAYMARMKHIKRWGLMNNDKEENIQEHSLQVAMIAHALALITNRIYGGGVDAEHIMAIAVYHETSEVLTGDLSTPIKYYNPKIKTAYKEIERIADEKLLGMIPEELRPDYEELIIGHTDEEYRLVKAADKICAYLKCVEELKTGNLEFKQAKASILAEIERMNIPAVGYFMEKFEPSFGLTLDELN
ncbi:MAG: 5'-deoxynucleotidase [Firmicutes bacterium]|nr:5'-deoxynucleotidase [Bacillota bacterium]